VKQEEILVILGDEGGSPFSGRQQNNGVRCSGKADPNDSQSFVTLVG